MYSTSLKNIVEEEAYFDILVPDPQVQYIEDPNTYKWERFTKEIIGTVTYAHTQVLVPWNLTDWDHLFTGGDSLFPSKIIRIHFRAGAYTHPLALIQEINEGLKRMLQKLWKTMGAAKTKMQLVYSTDYDRVEYQFSGKKSSVPLSVRFPKTLAFKLGVDSEKLIIPDESMTKWINVSYLGNTTIDLYENLKSMYVYCDIIDPQIVGSNELKLIRVVPNDTQREDRQQARWEPIRVEYLKLSKKHFDTIDIHIMTSLGTPVRFLNGLID
jgi:hypothetical protein